MTVANQFSQLPLFFFSSGVQSAATLNKSLFWIFSRIKYSCELRLTSPSSATLNQRGAFGKSALLLLHICGVSVMSMSFRGAGGWLVVCNRTAVEYAVFWGLECARVRKRRRLQHCLLYILSHWQIAKQKGRLAGGHTLPSSGLYCRWYAENAVLFRCRLVSSNKVIKHVQVPSSNGYNCFVCHTVTCKQRGD